MKTRVKRRSKRTKVKRRTRCRNKNSRYSMRRNLKGG